ncbi:PREDICTED: uncharacterized protein LOC109216224 [Nicotiana attenuata]|uniref:uncharacterized protein LOC109216224 n=1 Tax=Nicotiana attenuata TaxID=49451 RepID=UPI000905B9F5|nr:PREDICTED: uncharacterized protein LOC109216224 [Nicotiana attenuata]
MEPSGGIPPARTAVQSPPSGKIAPKEVTKQENISYANTISAPSSSSQIPNPRFLRLETVWFRRVIKIDEMQMWLQKRWPDFKPEEYLPVAPAWVLLPALPYHMHDWHYIKQLLSFVGSPLALDVATMGITRPSMAKIRVEVDLLKPLPQSVFVGQEFDDSPLKGYTQKLEYEGHVPKYGKYCQKVGHYIVNCRSLEKEKAAQEKEEGEGDKITKNNEDAQSMNKMKGNNNEGIEETIQADSHSVDIEKKQQEDGLDDNKIIKNKEEKSMKKKTKNKKAKKMPKKKSKVKFKHA